MMGNIEVDKIIRNIKLYLLTDSEMDKRPYLIYKCLESTFSNLYVYKDTDLNIIYFGKSIYDLIFSYNLELNYVKLNYENACETLNKSFHLSIESIISLISWYLKVKYNIEGYITNPRRGLDLDKNYGKNGKLKEYGKLSKELICQLK